MSPFQDIHTKSHFTLCDCSSHMLQTERYKYDDENDEGFNFAIWHYGNDGNIRGWKQRFRWCWRILTTGNPWADSIVATNKDARKIAEFILQNLPKEEPHEENK